VIVLCQDRGAKVKNSSFKRCNCEEGGAIAEGVMICMLLFPGSIENIYATVTL